MADSSSSMRVVPGLTGFSSPSFLLCSEVVRVRPPRLDPLQNIEHQPIRILNKDVERLHLLGTGGPD